MKGISYEVYYIIRIISVRLRNIPPNCDSALGHRVTNLKPFVTVELNN